MQIAAEIVRSITASEHKNRIKISDFKIPFTKPGTKPERKQLSKEEQAAKIKADQIKRMGKYKDRLPPAKSS